MARLLRARSGKSQEQFGEEIGVHPSLIAQIELGDGEPSRDLLRRMARVVGFELADARDLLAEAERLAHVRRGRVEGRADLLRSLPERLREQLSTALKRLWSLPRPVPLPSAEDRQKAESQWKRLEALKPDQRLAVVRADDELQNWALSERVCQESVRQASRKVEASAALARLGQEIAERVRGPEGFCRCLQGQAAAHGSNALRVVGELEAARVVLEKAKAQWASGSDPFGLLDPGRLLDLEASLCRAERRFHEAVALLDQALAVSHCPERVLIKKGFTLEVMGEYDRSIEALLQAIPRIDRQAEPRLWNIAHLNLANNYIHLGRFGEAVQLVEEVRPRAQESGDEIDLIRIGWLEGRLAAGLGRNEEARQLFQQARREFAALKMWHNVALALLEEAVVLLEQGQNAEVKELALGLHQVFESKRIHREAMAALHLFEEAARREAATAELGRSVLRYLFRAQHDKGLRFEAA
jgi:tetratricopeptide (TPR) repeat protein